jgi:hypothetical protein
MMKHVYGMMRPDGAIDELTEPGLTRTNLIEDGMRWVVATRLSREASRRRKEPEAEK